MSTTPVGDGGKKSTRGTFPGGNVVPQPGELRIAIEKRAYAEVIGHAVLEPEVEVCGVLVGRLLEDAHGDFLHITAAIRGEAAKQQGAQVTFTHETWNHIHREMDERYPDEQMVGWYHTHGGFGIFLSEMDTFIHRNFFSAPYQVAYVFDPLAGSEGFFHASDGKLVLGQRHWVGSRERRVVVREPGEAPSPPPSGGGGSPAQLGALASELHRTALALQALAHRPVETIPRWAWPAGLVLAAALGWALLGGRLPFAVRADSDVRDARLLLVLQREPSTGRAVGIELREAVPQDGPVYRDEAGHLYLAIEARGPDGSVLPGLTAILGQPAAAARAPPLSPPAPAGGVEKPAEATAGLARWLPVAAAGGVLAIAAGGAATWFLRRRRPS